MRKLYVPYTVVDCGFWHNISVPSLPSGKIDYVVPRGQDTIWGDGEKKTIVTDGGDVGKLVAKIIVDERTLNKYVVCCGDVLSQHEILDIMEKASGEKIEKRYVSVNHSSRLFGHARRLWADNRELFFPGIRQRIDRQVGRDKEGV